MFLVPPQEEEQLIIFDEIEHKLDKLMDWGLITATARKKNMLKAFVYQSSAMKEPIKCEVVGYIPYKNRSSVRDTVVLLIEDGLHKVMPEYLKEMQVGNNAKAKQMDCIDVSEVVAGKGKKASEMAGEQQVLEQIEKKYDFVAIDFETANANLNSACSIGIIGVKGCKVVNKKYFLIKPPTPQFDAKNIEIHGIKYEDVENERTFDNVWEEIKEDLSAHVLVAHNARFDMSVLKCCLEAYNIPVPDTTFICSMQISDHAFEEKTGKSLGERTKRLGISLENAHNALDDSLACAELVTRTLEINAASSLQQFIGQIKGIKQTELIGFKHQKAFGKPKASNPMFKNNIRIKDIEVTVDSVDKSHPIFEKAFVFTGDMQSISRKDAMQKVVNLGGVLKSGVSKKVSFVVVGRQDVNLVGDEGISSKERKAKELIEQGVSIEIIDEPTFIKMIQSDNKK